MNQDNNDNNSSNSNSNSNSNNNSVNDDANVNAEKGTSSSHMNDDDGLSNELSNMNIDCSSSSSSSRKKKKKNCLHCLQEVEGSSRCSKCRTALYCSTDCQEKHWPVHKNNCTNSNDAADSDQKLSMKAENHLNQGNLIYTNTSRLLISIL